MGAWIETVNEVNKTMPEPVAPYVGAWIETGKLNVPAGSGMVAPYVGAWIETCYGRDMKGYLCRTLRGCVD